MANDAEPAVELSRQWTGKTGRVTYGFHFRVMEDAKVYRQSTSQYYDTHGTLKHYVGEWHRWHKFPDVDAAVEAILGEMDRIQKESTEKGSVYGNGGKEAAGP